MAEDMGRGIMAPNDTDDIQTGAQEMRTLAATAANAIGELEQELEDLDSKYVRGDIRRIITTTNTNTTTQPGDLLIVTEPPRFYTDFRFNDTGMTPDGWSPEFDSGSDSWTVESSPDTPAGKVLRNHNPAHDRTGLAWDMIPDADIIEVLIKTRSVDRLSDTARPSIDMRMPLGGTWSYIHLSGKRTSLVIARDGSPTEANGTEIPHLAVGAWTYMRIRREQGRSYAKSWVEGTPEPSDWDISNGLLDPLPSGWVGIQSSRDGAEVAFVSVALDGGEAPKQVW